MEGNNIITKFRQEILWYFFFIKKGSKTVGSTSGIGSKQLLRKNTHNNTSKGSLKLISHSPTTSSDHSYILKDTFSIFIISFC